ncbi:MAG: TolC family protein, partial [Bacteroidales bacterium]|nr:TolC family protein [Bacteroidales bacterium]
TRCSEATEVYRIIEKRFRLGESPLIELLDARNNMTETEALVILTRYDYLVSIARLEKSSNSSLAM